MMDQLPSHTLASQSRVRLDLCVIAVTLLATAVLAPSVSWQSDIRVPAGPPSAQVARATEAGAIAPADWPQLGRDAQRTNYSPQQVNPPYCYAWKWYGVPMASRAQPVVASGRLFIGGMDGVMYARDATTGAELWKVQTGGPIRHSAGVLGGAVVFSSHDGFTYALNAADGALLWKRATGPSATAPLVDESRGWVYVASTAGSLTALRADDGATQWGFDAGAPILTRAEPGWITRVLRQ